MARRSVEELDEFLSDFEKVSGPSQHLKVTQWMASIDGKENYDAFDSRMEEKKPSTTQASAKNTPNSQKKQFQCEKAATSSEKRAKVRHQPQNNSQGYRIPKIQQGAMENVFQMFRTMMEF
ncbi:hypothetical protein O181_091919 [Austropuccinia psidii MF-1]|uniref:Uncharacterized protein n=1 Tax=Austropuccinia psidii MF-1 TaxID=1389203 RepID=A0A9Q3IYH6_9BASI|nr:hypothetical protein [Austropuccinia psidii MF-1]